MKDKLLVSALALATLASIFYASPFKAQATATFRGGNIFDGGNRTDRLVDWEDPIPADPGEVIEFRVLVQNDGDENAQNTTVKVEFPTSPSLNLVSTVLVSSTNGSTVSDTITVKVSGSTLQLHSLIPGHTKMFGPGCSPCVLPDSINGSGVTIGPVVPGTSNSFQVLFKAYVTNKPGPTPTPPAGPTSACTGLSASPTSGVAPLLARFTGSGFDSAGSIQEYEFNFGDASGGQPQIWKQTSPEAAHRYEVPGTFTATLKVRDSRGNWLESSDCRKTITVSAVPVVLAAEAPEELPETGLPAAAGVGIISLGSLGVYLLRRFRLV